MFLIRVLTQVGLCEICFGRSILLHEQFSTATCEQMLLPNKKIDSTSLVSTSSQNTSTSWSTGVKLVQNWCMFIWDWQRQPIVHRVQAERWFLRVLWTRQLLECQNLKATFPGPSSYIFKSDSSYFPLNTSSNSFDSKFSCVQLEPDFLLFRSSVSIAPHKVISPFRRVFIILPLQNWGLVHPEQG